MVVAARGAIAQKPAKSQNVVFGTVDVSTILIAACDLRAYGRHSGELDRRLLQLQSPLVSMTSLGFRSEFIVSILEN